MKIKRFQAEKVYFWTLQHELSEKEKKIVAVVALATLRVLRGL